MLLIAACAAAFIPFMRFLVTGWAAKRKDIMDGLGEQARVAYFEMFVPADKVPKEEDAIKAFEDFYTRWFGRRFFAVPAVVFCIVVLIASTLIVVRGLRGVGYLNNTPLFDLPWTATAAISGAYLWVCNDFISQGRRLDLTPADVSWGSLRLIIAVPMGYAFASIASDSAGPFVAFALGAFPLSALTLMLNRLTSKKLGLDASPGDVARYRLRCRRDLGGGARGPEALCTPPRAHVVSRSSALEIHQR
jgi:hypothetical protein